MDVDREVSGKNIEDCERSKGGNVRVDRGNGSRKGTFLRRGSVSLAEKEGKEMVGAEAPELRVTDWREGKEVAEATAAGENLTMVKIGMGANKH